MSEFNSPELFLEEWDPQKLAHPRYGSDHEWTWRRCELAAAAPAMVRVLVDLEWSTELVEEIISCPECGQWPPYGGFHSSISADRYGHKNCPLDAALTAAGLPDQVSRDRLRELIEERSG
jgi:hypothetical protein